MKFVYSCVGICYLIRLRMMKDKKYRRGLQNSITEDEEQNDVSEDYDEFDQEQEDFSTEKNESTEVTTTATVEDAEDNNNDNSVFSQLLWNSFMKKIELREVE